jgi:AAA family ATPase
MSYAPFALRPLERRTPLSALEGGFRVHLSPLSLRAFGLVAGDLVRIQSTSAVTDPFETAPDGRSSCIAIAWQAADTNMGSASKPIAKVTELLRETYGFKLADKVEILPVLKGDQEAAWRAAKTVWVRLGAGEEKENLGVGVWLAAYGCVEEVERWAGVALGA